ncbi:hypothetical protein CBL_00814 [Carabus blaptoides fortunei]
MSNADGSTDATTISLFDEEKKNLLIRSVLTQLDIIKSEMHKFNKNATIVSTKFSNLSTKCNSMTKTFEMLEKNGMK